MPVVLIALPVLVLATLAGCDDEDPGWRDDPPTTVEPRLTRFQSCDEMQAHLADTYVEMLVQARYGTGWDIDVLAADAGPTAWVDDEGAQITESSKADDALPSPDLLETDEDFLYVARPEGSVTIARSWPPEQASVVAQAPVTGEPHDLLLADDRLVVFSRVHQGYEPASLHLEQTFYGTRITLFDVSDPTKPQQVRAIEVEGLFVDAGLTGTDLYLATSRPAKAPSTLWDVLWNGGLNLPEMRADASDSEQAQVRAQARELLRPVVEDHLDASPADAWLPQVQDHGPDGALEAGPLLDCTDVRRPQGLSRPSLLTVTHLDVGADDALQAQGLMSEGWQIHLAQNRLYVAQASHWWWWGWEQVEQETHLHRLDLDGAELRDQGSGRVPGWLPNRFAMQARDAHLWVFTTNHGFWSDEGANHVFSVRSEGPMLAVAGELRDLLPGSRLIGARFLGSEAYLVTSKPEAPLARVDLSDPRQPSALGDLDVPGRFSHPVRVAPDRLVTVGVEPGNDGTLALGIRLFDDSDPMAPSVVDARVFEGAAAEWAEGLWTPRAVTLAHDVLAVPLYGGDDAQRFSGMVALGLEPGGLSELGRVDHGQLAQSADCTEDTAEPDACDPTAFAAVRRGEVLGPALYSLSDHGILVNDLFDPSWELGSVSFE